MQINFVVLVNSSAILFSNENTFEICVLFKKIPDFYIITFNSLKKCACQQKFLFTLLISKQLKNLHYFMTYLNFEDLELNEIL